jgi:tRNA pseudouridine38-40 synthase
MVAFDTQVRIPSRGWALGLTRLLPPAVAIVRAARVNAGFDPRAHVVSKTYRYLLHVSKVRDPFLRGRAWHIREELDLDRMCSEAQALVGEHDYAAFRAASDERSDTRCRLIRLNILPCRTDRRLIDVEVEGDRFLHRMVRIIIGSLVDAARGRLEAGAIRRALATGSRADLGITAPPDGLYLDSVALMRMGQDPWPNTSSD